MLFGLLATVALAQSPEEALRRMLASKAEMTAYLVKEARRVTDRAAEELATREAWEKVRDQRRREMRDMLGLDPWPARTPLNARITGRTDKPQYTIEKITFESLPKFYVSANLYIPKKRAGPLPAIVYVCGHSLSPHGAKAMYQRHGITFARNGYVCMILDPIQIAETFALHHGVLNQEMYDWYARGYTPAGVEAWNAIRAMDYLETRPEADPKRFGMTGRSGGAAMSWFTAAVDERVKVVAPVMGISTYAANVEANTQRRHCDCMFAINTYLHDMMHQGALIAPRPLYMMHGKKDLLFPVPGYEEFERRIGALYASYGQPDRFRNLVVDTGHADSDLLRGEAVKWFDRWLKDVPGRQPALEYTDEPAADLAVFGGSPPADAQNFRVHEIFNAPSRTRGSNAELVATLRQKVLRAFPAEPAPLNVKTGASVDGFQPIEFSSEEGITVHARWRPGPGPGLLNVASDGEDRTAIRDTLRQALSNKAIAVLVVYPRGVSEIPWDKTFWKDTLRNAMHVGRTVDSMRLWDVKRAAEIFKPKPERLTVLGKGVSGVLGLYAAILDPAIDQVMLLDPPSSHRQGPIFLNVLRYTDLAEAATLIAPRPLIFYGRVPEAFARVPHKVAMSIEPVVRGRLDHNFTAGY
jgi:cephalosporin-C deacetylase-like acetyl esterase